MRSLLSIAQRVAARPYCAVHGHPLRFAAAAARGVHFLRDLPPLTGHEIAEWVKQRCF